jgi:3-methyl-2-oxobutanoate hydroxymethyltransferase
MGGFRVQGKSESEALSILADAEAVERAGAYAVVVEGVPASLGRRITERVGIPTIGIGAGPDCDGQVLVCYDFLGMVRGFSPKFVKHFAELGDEVVRATRAYVDEVRAHRFPGPEHSFGRDQQSEPTTANVPSADAGAHVAVAYGPAGEER